ncbi:MAG: hypothetical protein MRQ09_00360 [Candidatus Midichloria sp.]|nr:hypothetical protein [Candidatus Midichloria sp.]
MNYPYLYESNITNATKVDVNTVISDILPLFESHLAQNFDTIFRLKGSIKKNFNALVIIGMGGAINSPALLLGLGKNSSFKIHILDTPDPLKNELIKDILVLKETAFLVISNSGSTIETLTIAQYWIKEILVQNLLPHNHFYFILGNNKISPLQKLAAIHNCQILPHINFSGRFAIFSNITVLPAVLADLDVKGFFNGAYDAIDDLKHNRDFSIMAKSAFDVLYLKHNNMLNHVLVAYNSLLTDFLNWKCQIIAESLGKEGHGITPIQNSAPQCQHSYFQLYIDGPKDKFFTFFLVDKHIKDQEIWPTNHTLAKVIETQSSVSYDFFKKNCLPVRKIQIKCLNEYTLGFLTMHTILETAIIAKHLKIDLFNQPGVERIKAALQASLT